MSEPTTVFVVYEINKDFGEDSTKTLVGIFLSKDEAEYVSKSFWASIEEIEVNKLFR